jgi:mannose-6-phosphate isomerase-like protein (cupin superfamily)
MFYLLKVGKYAWLGIDIDMRQISDIEASTQHGVATSHSEMASGEYRFRLKKTDGTAYIRTESSHTGGWQESHYHRRVRETYIIQRGWIAYAVMTNNRVDIKLYHEGELFTTQPQSVHSVYMPGNSIIHTVKHGNADGDDRITDPTTEALDRELVNLSDEKRLMERNSPDPAESPAYRHYDDLIWRLPVWATGIISVTVIGLGAPALKIISEAISAPPVHVASIYLLLIFSATLAFSYFLHRFRLRQKATRPLMHERTPFWKSASTYNNLLICVESSFLLYLAVLLNGFATAWLLPLCCAFGIGLAVVYEFHLRTRS